MGVLYVTPKSILNINHIDFESYAMNPLIGKLDRSILFCLSGKIFVKKEETYTSWRVFIAQDHFYFHYAFKNQGFLQ